MSDIWEATTLAEFLAAQREIEYTQADRNDELYSQHIVDTYEGNVDQEGRPMNWDIRTNCIAQGFMMRMFLEQASWRTRYETFLAELLEKNPGLMAMQVTDSAALARVCMN